METVSETSNRESIASDCSLEFLWLELTNQCNLKCVHCYSDSGPESGGGDMLNRGEQIGLLSEAFQIGCRRVQFIGGEPTLNNSLPELIRFADDLGYQLIEVYSNLIRLDESLLVAFARHNVAVATSVYADDPLIHDAITQSPGSHSRTISNIKRVLAKGLPLRVGVIGMKENQNAIEATFTLLHEIGVAQISFDHVRQFGRGNRESCGSMGELCGNCANNILAIGPDGIVAPCIMSKEWSVGSVRTMSLKQIAASDVLLETRRRIADASRNYGPCEPDRTCNPNCTPSYSCLPCTPNGGQPCQPNRWCDPSKR